MGRILIIAILAAIQTQPGLPTSPQQSAPKSPTGVEKRSDQAASGPVAKSVLVQALKRLWQYLTDENVALPPIVDSKRVYLALAGGRTVCLDRESGSLLWSNDSGGVIDVPISTDEKAVYIATHRVADDGSEAGASLRAIDKITGLTLWARDYSRPFTSQPVPLHNHIYVGSADGACYALSPANGEVVWKVQTQDVVRGAALVTDSAVYFGSDDGALYSVDRGSGREIWKSQTGGRVVGKPCSDGRALYFGSADGFVYSIELTTGSLRWRARTGAAVEASPTIMHDRIVVGSFDNFVYCFARTNGNRIWKRRFDNRISAAAIVEGDSVLIAPLRGNQLSVLLQSNGQLISYYKLDGESEVVAQPAFEADTLVLPTDKGLIAVAVTKPSNTPTNAVKK